MSKRVRLYRLDGKLPNVALLRLGAHHQALGDRVELRTAGNLSALERGLWDDAPDLVYASLIFERTRPLAERLLEIFPSAVVGGTGWDFATRLEDVGVATEGPLAYDLVPGYRHSIGFSQRGCRLKCQFCVVPRKEGAVRETATIADLWRGDPWPREVVLLDNDPTGQPRWPERVRELNDGGFKVSLSQGFNVRLVDDAGARLIASLDYWNDSFTRRALYVAWDFLPDERRVFDGLARLEQAGVARRDLMVFMLVGYWPDETEESRVYRVQKIREWGATPYPMPFDRTRRDLAGLARWTNGAYDKRVPWAAWKAAGYRPERLGGEVPAAVPLFPSLAAQCASFDERVSRNTNT